MNFVHKIYTIYASIIFGALLVALFPFYLLISKKKKWHKYNHLLNRIWARTFSILAFMPFHIEFRHKLNRKGQYIYCSNHFSYFDIATMAFAPTDFMFTGKESLTRAPGLGFIFKKFHITVDRFSSEGRKTALEKYFIALDEGKSLVIFPEGGIYSENPPEMAEFRHGAFTAAIQKKVPIVPVTIPFNWKILPDNGNFLIRRRPIKAIFHKPVETAHLTLDDVDSLKMQVFQIIQKELNKQNDANRQGNFAENRSPGKVRLQ